MPRSSAHALLRTLMSQGWVRSDDVGHVVRHRHPRAARRNELSRQRSVPADDHAVPRRSAQRPRRDVPPRPPRRHRRRLSGDAGVPAVPAASPSRVGRRLPAYATALGQGAAGRAVRRRARRARPGRADAVDAAARSSTAPVLDEALETARVRGYATDDEENTAGRAVLRGRAALHAARPRTRSAHRYPIARLTPEREREIVEALRTVGDKVIRVLRPVANGDKWFASVTSADAAHESMR